jgi:hypothetical protein
MKTYTKLFLGAVIAAAFGSTDLSAQTCKGPQPTICERNCWNARSPSCSIGDMAGIKRAVIHHTASSSHYSTGGLTESKSNMRGVQNYHMDSNGWCDIGYHFLVDKHGNIFEGRAHSADPDWGQPQGAHDGCNDRSFGFTAMGYFHAPYNNNPTTALMNALEKTIAWRMPAGWKATDGSASLPSYCGDGSADAVLSHREVKATACPGDILHNKVKNGSGFENAINSRRGC